VHLVGCTIGIYFAFSEFVSRPNSLLLSPYYKLHITFQSLAIFQS